MDPGTDASAVTTIGITGSFGGLNAGDEAILTSVVASLRERLPAVELVVFSRDEGHTRAHHDVESVVPVRELTRDEIAAHVQPLDLLLLAGATVLYADQARAALREVRLAQNLGIATMAFGVGAAPPADPDDRELVRQTLNGMRSITVRDVGAKRILEHLDVEAPVEVTADPALLLTPEPFAPERLRVEGVPAGRALVGMSLREPGAAKGDIDADAYHSLLGHAADFVVDRLDSEIVFIPLEPDEVRTAHAVIARMVSAHHAHVLTRQYRPAELLGLMQHLDMVLAMRLPMLMFAAMAGTPFVALPAAPAVAEFLRSMGLPAPPPATAAGSLLAAVDRVWDLRDREAARLRAQVRALQERARRSLEIALQLLPSGAPNPVVVR
jgi:polysaccharide pyruvyl transferase WcaK-like protein